MNKATSHTTQLKKKIDRIQTRKARNKKATTRTTITIRTRTITAATVKTIKTRTTKTTRITRKERKAKTTVKISKNSKWSNKLFHRNNNETKSQHRLFLPKTSQKIFRGLEEKLQNSWKLATRRKERKLEQEENKSRQSLQDTKSSASCPTMITATSKHPLKISSSENTTLKITAFEHRRPWSIRHLKVSVRSTHSSTCSR